MIVAHHQCMRAISGTKVRLTNTIVGTPLVGATIVAASMVAGSAGAAPATGRWAVAGVGVRSAVEAPVSHLVAHCGDGGQCGGGPSGNLSNELDGVSCVSSTNCVAVGSYFLDDAHPRRTLIESWNGITWTMAPSPNPGTASFLYGVSCVSSSNCVAVGSYGNAWPPDKTLVESWNGNTWTVVPSPNPAGSNSGFEGVSCTSTTNCMAVGAYGIGSGFPDHTLIESWNGITWVIASSLSPGSTYNHLQSVSCTSTTNCVAVGGYRNGDALPNQTLVESWNGSTWIVVPSPNPLPYSSDGLTGVSCTTPVNCVAVGSDSDGVNVWRTLTEAWDGTSWRVVSSPSLGTFSILSGVSCTSTTNCVAVGRYYSEGSADNTLVETWNGGAWSVTPSPSPPGSFTVFVFDVSCTTATWCVAVGYSANSSGDDVTLVESWNGTAWSIVTSTNVRRLLAPVVGMASTPNGDGYWLADSAGDISTHGTAVNYGSMGGQTLNAPVTHIVATPDGKGYWLVAADGGTFSFGDAQFYGSMGGKHLNAPVVDIAPTPSGHGYWLVASDGGIFSFGDAAFAGSMGGQHLNQPVVGMAADAHTGGYWEVAMDGGIFSFNAPFYGSMGAAALNKPVLSMASTLDGGGYWFAASDGGVFAFGDAAFHGSMGGQLLNAPVVGMAADLPTGGYWLTGADGGIFSFGVPFFGAG
jgi:hypothetical protein